MDNQESSLITFAKSVIQTAFDGGDLDGGQIQEMGIKHGLLIESKYDPDIHGSDLGYDFAPGDTIYMLSDVFKSSSTG